MTSTASPRLNARMSDGSTHTVELPAPLDETTVGQLKGLIGAPEKANAPPEALKLVYRGRILKDEHTLDTYCTFRNPVLPSRRVAFELQVADAAVDFGTPSFFLLLYDPLFSWAALPRSLSTFFSPLDSVVTVCRLYIL